VATDFPIDDPLQVTARIATAFEQLGIRYLVGGSLSSSLHGIPRATQDIDIVAELRVEHVLSLVERLGNEFYVDDARVNAAVGRGEAFNVIDRETLIKVDVFVCGDDALSRDQMARRVAYDVPSLGIRLYLSTAEDIICHKLYWFRLGGEVSERQWDDVVNVLRVQQNRLDTSLLNRIASARGVTDLLERAVRRSSV
jgi:hypothetical protein